MKRKILALALALYMISAIDVAAGVDEAKTETKSEAKGEGRPALTLEEAKKLLGMSLYLQGGYTYNFVNPDSGTNEQRLFDKKANTFLLDLAQIQLAKDPPMGGLGTR